MSVLVTGSLAYDHIMVFEDRFKNHILPDKVHMLNVSFLVPSMDKRWGGCAGNIAYNLRILEVDPLALGTVGHDFGPYAEWMDRCGMRRDGVRVLEDAFTAQAFITTDLDDNQITAFHPGAMDRAHEAPVSSVAESLGAAIVGPNSKRAMQEHARALKQRGVPTVIDPGQAMPLFDGPELLELLDGAAVYVVNDYEWALTEEKTGLNQDELAKRVGALIVTRGDQGSWLLCDAGETRESVPPVAAEKVVDPTGCGDAYRAGVLYALERDLPLAIGARIGGLFGALKVARHGPQSIPLDPAAFRERYQREFGEALP